MGGGGILIFIQEFVQLVPSKALLRISMFYYAWNWSKSLCGCGGAVWSNMRGGYPYQGNCHGKGGEDEGVDPHPSLKSKAVALVKSQI